MQDLVLKNFKLYGKISICIFIENNLISGKAL